MAVAEVEGRTTVLAFGGNFGASFGEGTPQQWDLWRLDFERPLSWIGPLAATGASAVEARGGFGAATLGDDTTVVVGGYGEGNGGHPRGVVSLSLSGADCPAWRNEGAAEGVEARSGATLTALRGGDAQTAVLYGGYGEISGGDLRSVYRATLSPSSSDDESGSGGGGVAWDELQQSDDGGGGAHPEPEPRCAHAAASASSSTVLVHGGYGATSGPLSDLWALRVDSVDATFAWTPVVTTGVAPSARSGHCFVEVGRSGVYLVWGGVGVDGVGCSDAFLYDAAAARWERVDNRGDAPAPRYNCRAAAVGDSAVVVSGGYTCDLDGVPGRAVGEVFCLELQPQEQEHEPSAGSEFASDSKV
jgi:hypothetical protein